MSKPVSEAMNTILDLQIANSTHCSSCPRYHNRSQDLPDCNCFFAQRLQDAYEELIAVRKFVAGMKALLK